MIVGIDAGNNKVKVAGPLGIDSFSSTLGEYRERNLEQLHGKDDMIFEYRGRKGFAGSLAEAESEFCGSIMGDSKAHEDTKIRVLIALHRYCQTTNNFDVVVGQPISKHSAQAKQRIKQMLLGPHEITVNSKTKYLNINRIEVAAEAGAAFWSNPIEGKVHIVDAGSATVNCATLQDGRYVDRDSFTLSFGCNTNKSNDLQSMVRGIVTHTSKKWDLRDTVFITGGAAEQLLPYIRDYYTDSAVLSPVLEGKPYESIFSNAIGFYMIGRSIYG